MITSEVIKHFMIAVISCLIQVLKSRSDDGFLVARPEIQWAPPPLSSPSRARKNRVLMNCGEIMDTLLSLMTSNLLEGNIWLADVSLWVKNTFLSCGHEQFFSLFPIPTNMKGPYWKFFRKVGKMTKGTNFKKNISGWSDFFFFFFFLFTQVGD